MSPLFRRWWPALTGLALVVAVFTLPLSGVARSGHPRPAATTPAAAPASLGIRAVSDQKPPSAGEARYVAGPFSDRLRLLNLSLKGRQVSGLFAQVADNSSILVMEVQADFYDRAGRLLGSRRTTLRQPDVVRTARGGTGPKRYGGDVAFTIGSAPAWGAQVTGALVSVPVLVNE